MPDTNSLLEDNGLLPNYYKEAAKTIENFEGYTPVAKWDVNAYRGGYGSDTTGSGIDQIPVQKGQFISKEEADQNISSRIPEYEDTIIKQVGQDKWDALPDNAKEALLSTAYNYGKLPKNIAEATAATPQSLTNIARAEMTHMSEQGGINSRRRLLEAQQIDPNINQVAQKVQTPKPKHKYAQNKYRRYAQGNSLAGSFL